MKMQKNTKLIAITAMIAVIGAFSFLMMTFEENELASPQEKIYQNLQTS